LLESSARGPLEGSVSTVFQLFTNSPPSSQPSSHRFPRLFFSVRRLPTLSTRFSHPPLQRSPLLTLMFLLTRPRTFPSTDILTLLFFLHRSCAFLFLARSLPTLTSTYEKMTPPFSPSGQVRSGLYFPPLLSRQGLLVAFCPRCGIFSVAEEEEFPPPLT